MDLTLIFVGALVSITAEIIQKKLGIQGIYMMALVAILALITSAGMVFLKYLGYWEVFMQIVVGAGATYAFIIKNVNESNI